MEIFCSNCGSKIISNSRYCSKCGSLSASRQESRSRKKHPNAFIILWRNRSVRYGAILALVSIFVIILLYTQYRIIKQAEFNATKASQDAALQISEARDELAKTKEQILKDVAEEKSRVQKIITQQQQSKPPSVSEIVSKWRPIVAYIECDFKYTSGVVYKSQSGSGTLIIKDDGTRSVLTNEHVLDDGTGYGPSVCRLKFPNDETVFVSSFNDITTPTEGVDVGSIAIPNPNSYLKNLTSEGRRYCNDEPSVGSQVVILGYPGIGSPTGITATEGIISGYDGNHYVTSAKVEHGNSGGAAIDVARNCYLGIPTYAERGRLESLARILKWQAF